EGHGEGDIESPQLNGYGRVKQALENQAFVVKPLFLARQPNVPADCSALLIAGPAQEPLPDEMSAIEKYLESGGRVCALVDPAPGDADVQALAQTGPDSFAEPFTGSRRRAQFDPKLDKRGPIVLAAAATRETTAGKQARVVAIGSSNFISNAFFDKAGNGDL